MSRLRPALLKTLAFHDTWAHAPTRTEWLSTLEWSGEDVLPQDVWREIDALVKESVVTESMGRIVFPDRLDVIETIRTNEAYAPRKRRVSRRIAAWLARLGGVRFVALCNTTALGHASDESDLDFFIITRHGSIMQTRALAALPFKLLGRRPGAGEERDAACFSYFVSDRGLDLPSHMLPDDPYFRYWFLSLLPLVDDGVSREFWEANPHITRRHPFAQAWIAPPDLRVGFPSVRIPVLSRAETSARKLQEKAFPAKIKNAMNMGTAVIVNDAALKFHVDDGREEYRQRYEENCRKRGIDL